MNTFNNLHVSRPIADWRKYAPDWKGTLTVRKAMRRAADLGVILPAANKADRAKLKPYYKAIASAITSGDKHLSNSSHWVRSGVQGWTNKDRLAALSKAIAKLSKLNAGVLAGGLPLKTALIEAGWLAYAKLEMHGLDNAHFVQTNIPTDERLTVRHGRGVGWLYHDPKQRKPRTLPDSRLSPEAQWLALELADAFSTRRRIRQPEPLNAGPQTPCMGPHQRPLPTHKPFGNLPIYREPLTAGIGSGLPFEVHAESAPQVGSETASREWRFNSDWDSHPQARRVDNSDAAIADNLAWLASLKKRA